MDSSKKKRTIPEEMTDRIVVFGFHPNDKREPKKIFAFWASNFLMEQYPCEGDIVRVKVKRMQDGKLRKRRAELCITDVQKWQEGMYVPTRIATKLI